MGIIQINFMADTKQHYLNHRGDPRVVVTGMGAISPIGHSVEESWQGLLNGRSGVAPITQYNTDDYDIPYKIAGEVKGFKVKNYMNFKEARRMSRCSQLAVAAATMALADANLSSPVPDGERTGVLIGTGAGGFDVADDGMQTLRQKGFARVNPFTMPAFLSNMPSYHVSLLAKAYGPISTVVAACATGTQAIGEATEMIRRGRADRMITGGSEGLIHPAALAGFGAMRALTLGGENPEKASKPFDKNRDGFVFSEGSAVLILERLETAIERGAKIYGEIKGYASSSDAFHVAVPDAEAAGAVRAMQWAIEEANIPLQAVQYVNAHGTSTPINDVTETFAIKRLFGEYAYELAVSSSKSVTGHMMGGAGAIEAIFCLKALQEQIIPPTWHYETPDPDCDLDYVPNAPRPTPLTVTMSNSFGLGGQNACLVISQVEESLHGRSA